MLEFFKIRTRAHLYLVHKWSNVITNYIKCHDILPIEDIVKIIEERDRHDEGKWVEPEYTPYVYMTWKYREKRYGRTFEISEEIKEQIHLATFHHVKSHRHHPEFWDENAMVNPVDRDKAPETIVDGTKMPMCYIASMVADWLAMSEELGTDPKNWIKNNVNIRWKFTPDQLLLINKLVDVFLGQS